METDQLCDEAEGVGVRLDREAAERLLLLCGLVRRSPHNLTAIRDPEAMRRKHIVDSLACLPAAALMDGETVVDLGSGGGFPGIPVAVVRPEVRVVLVDSVAKKASFLRDAAGQLHLTNVEVLAVRAEDMGRQVRWRGQVDCVTARAVAPLSVLTELALPLCRVGGRLIALKASGVESEIAQAARAMAEVGGRVAAQRVLTLPGGGEQRVIVRIDKTGPTPERYPRRPGIPARHPL